MGNPVVVHRYAIAVGQLIDEGRVGGIADNLVGRVILRHDEEI
jgi:hypothetical protein